MPRRSSSERARLRSALLAVVALLVVVQPAAARDGDVAGVPLTARLFAGMPHDVVYQDPYAYVAIDAGVEIFDVSSPASPTPIGGLFLNSPAFAIDVVGSIIYVANGESGLTVLDSADPMNPVIIGRLPLPFASGAEVRDISVAGGLAVLAESAIPGSTDYGVRTVDVTIPAAPVELGRSTLDNGARSVLLVGSTAYVGIGSELGGRRGLIAVDVSAPASPVELGGSFLDLGNAVNDIARDSNTLYLAAGGRSNGALVAADISTPGSPSVLDMVALTDGAMAVALTPGAVWIAARERGLRVFDRTTPTDLTLTGSAFVGEATVAVAPRGDVAFVGARSSNGHGGLVAVDTLSAGAMNMLGWWPYAEATGVAAGSATGYLLRRDSLHVFDISAPGTPLWLGEWRPPDGDFSSICLEGSIAAVAEGANVHLVDVGAPSTPTAIGTAVLSQGVAVRPVLVGATLYVATGNGLETFDVSSPSAPVALSFLATAGQSSSLSVSGAIGYLVAGEELLVLDLSSPGTPSIQATVTIPGEQLFGVAADEALVVASGLMSRLYTFDVSMPTSPTLTGTLSGTHGFDVVLIGDRAVVAAGRDGVRVIDVSTPATPVEEAYHDTSGTASHLAADGQYLLAATLAAQHWIVECTTCVTTCVETWPGVDPNSLLVVKVPTRDTFHWTVTSGSGSFNLHRTAVKAALPDLWMDMSSAIASSATPEVADPFLPPTPDGIAYYRVFGAGSCNGTSYP